MTERTLKKKSEIALCVEMGKLAFDEGMKCIPANDKRIMSVIADEEKRTITTIQVLKAWIDGWTQANLKGKAI